MSALDDPWTPFSHAEVIKCDPRRDFYVAWSHIVEAPTWCGTWSEAFTAGCDMDRLHRADENGSSWHLVDQYGHAQPGLWWNAGGLTAEQLGYLPRARLAAYVTAYCQDRLGAAYAMLERFDDVTAREGPASTGGAKPAIPLTAGRSRSMGTSTSGD